MKNQEILNQEEQDQLPGIIQTFTSVYKGASKQISYSEIYNSIYKLCKKGYADEIINQLSKVSTAHFDKILKGLEQQNTKISDIVSAISEVRQSIQRISQILLYIDSNYMNDQKKQHHTIRETLNFNFFTALYENKIILTKIGKQTAEARVKGTEAEIIPLIETINKLDEKQVFFPQFVYQIYLQIVSNHFKNVFSENYKNLNFKQFLIATRSKFQEEREWLHKYFARVKGKKIIQELLRKIFQESFNELKQKIYKQRTEELLQTENLQFLELLSEKREEKQLNTFNDWYLDEIKKRLVVIDRKNNSHFLKEFIKQYLKVSKYLENTKNFTIGFKVTFFFQNWINEDKNHLPRRLNIFCQDILESTNKKEDLENFVILFKFLKEKTYFQKEFRRICVLRMIYDANKSHSQTENAMINQMGKQCAPEWIQKLNSLTKSTEQSLQFSTQLKSNLRLLVVEDAVWPFQKLKTQAILPARLLSLLGNSKQLYEQKFKGRVIQMHPFQGYVRLAIKFNQSNPQFKMDNLMATVLLNLQSLNFKSTVKKVLQQTKLSIEEVVDQLKTLSKQKLLFIQKDIKDEDFQNSQIELNLQYVPKQQGKLIDLTQRYIQQQFIESNEYEQLKSQKKMMVQAFIVKIMKSNKTITDNSLYSQITPMIQARGYKFNEGFVNNAFKGLIDKRYIKQQQDGTYSYLAS